MIRSSKRHLTEVGETYFEHLATALGFSAALAKAAGACALHALIPALCTHSASRSIATLHSTLAKRGLFAAPAAIHTHERSGDHRLRIDS